MDKYLKQHPELDLIYRFKERLYEFYRTKGVVRSVRGFYKFMNQLKGTGYKALLKLAKTIERWKKEIYCILKINGQMALPKLLTDLQRPYREGLEDIRTL